MKLSERLSTIIEFVPKSSFVADIGTDHALVPIYLIKHGIIKRAIATDIERGPLGFARANITKYELEAYIELRQTDGCLGLEDSAVDCLIIAGMGGAEIVNILAMASTVLNNVSTLILQPQDSISEVRLWLAENSWSVQRERLIKENGKIYEIIQAKREIMADLAQDFIRMLLPVGVGVSFFANRHPLLIERTQSELEHMQRVLIGMKQAKEPDKRAIFEAELKLDELSSLLKMLGEK